MNIEECEKVLKQLKRANKLENELSNVLLSMAEVFQPYIPYPVFALYQPSDGFVLCWKTGDTINRAPVNEPIDEAISNLTKDKNYYKEL